MMASTSALQAPPLEATQLANLAELVSTFDQHQLHWTSGYLAGLAAANNQASPREGSDSAPKLTILFGSQTGNGKRLAEGLRDAATDQGMVASLQDMADYQTRQLAREQLLLLVVSTHGEGDPPDDAEELLDYLMSQRAPKLSELQFAVLALGDSSYQNFCQTGRELDLRLEQLGARRLLDRQECDLDFESDAGEWQRKVLETVEPLLRDQNTAETVPLLRAIPSSPVPTFTRTDPYQAEVLLNQKITSRDSDKDVRHIELKLDAPGLEYLSTLR